MKISVNIKAKRTKLIVLLLFVLFSFNANSQSTYCIESGSDQITGEEDGFRYELWNQNLQGTACMTIDSGALFSGEWNGVKNYLARRGLGYNRTQQHQEIGAFYTTYNCLYAPSSATGNSYLSVYGWTVEPLVEYYIIEDWRNWIPSKAETAIFKDTIKDNGSIYDIYENTRIEQPSILGTETFQQYFSIRRNKRNSGSINISKHFNKWESLGMDLGNLHEVSFVVEGYESDGSFAFTSLDIYVDKISGIGYGKPAYPNVLSVFPNPASDLLFIKNKFDKSVVEIYNNYGQLIMHTEIKGFEDNIDISSLPTGNYLITLKTTDNIISGKLIVN